MRPIDKGATPKDVHGDPVTVTEYRQWRRWLIDRIGYYCVYCNVPLTHNLQVEHVVAKVPLPGHQAGNLLAWANMLLACGPCNLAKSNQPTPPGAHYFPEENNPLLAFRAVVPAGHPDALVIAPAMGLNAAQEARAGATITLLALDNVDTRDAVVDLRWKFRRDAGTAVDTAHALYLQACQAPGNDPVATARQIAVWAKNVGFFALWFERFRDEPEVIRQLVDSNNIPGTAQACFDPANGYRLLARNPDHATDPL